MRNALIIVIFCVLSSCQKDLDAITTTTRGTTTGNSNDISINGITGTYKGGILKWVINGANNTTPSIGIDSNFSFIATYQSNKTVNISFTTIAPIPNKQYSLLYLTQSLTSNFATYDFAKTGTDSLISLEFNLVPSGITLYKSFATINFQSADYTNSATLPAIINYSGTAIKQ